jgi:hypothetical protein
LPTPGVSDIQDVTTNNYQCDTLTHCLALTCRMLPLQCRSNATTLKLISQMPVLANLLVNHLSHRATNRQAAMLVVPKDFMPIARMSLGVTRCNAASESGKPASYFIETARTAMTSDCTYPP